jgi:DNA-directed RNA polymerase specialized sigma24 family protein
MSAAALRQLTRQQFRVVALLYHDGCDYKHAAARLGIKVRTVRMHVEYVARDLPGQGPPTWRVLRHAERLLEMGYRGESPDEDANAA